jgi:hypothetical protein
MTVLWVVAGVALLVALTAWVVARRAARRTAELSEMYWELKYQHGELRAQLLQVQGPRRTGAEAAPLAPAAPGKPPDVFVPLTSLKR